MDFENQPNQNCKLSKLEPYVTGSKKGNSSSVIVGRKHMLFKINKSRNSNIFNKIHLNKNNKKTNRTESHYTEEEEDPE